MEEMVTGMNVCAFLRRCHKSEIAVNTHRSIWYNSSVQARSSNATKKLTTAILLNDIKVKTVAEEGFSPPGTRDVRVGQEISQLRTQTST